MALQGITRGGAQISLGMLAFTGMAACIKATAGDVPTGQAVFFRATCAIPVILIWLASQGQLTTGLRTNNWKGHAARGTIGTLAMALGFAGLGLLPLPEVTAVRFATPIFIVIFGAVLLGERVRSIRITAVLLGLVGVTIILLPRFGGPMLAGAGLGAALTLASAVLAALAQILVKGMSRTEKTGTIVFYHSVIGAAMALFTLPFGWVVPAPATLALLVGSGFIGAIGQILLTSSYQHADAGALAPFTYTSMLWSLAVGWILFGETATWLMLLGSIIVIAAGAIIVWRERQLGKDDTARRKVRAKGIL